MWQGQGQTGAGKQMSTCLEFVLLFEDNPTGGMRLQPCFFISVFIRKGDTAAGGTEATFVVLLFFLIGY